MARLIVVLTLLVTLIGCALSQASSSAKDSAADAALNRTRKQVRMLDDIYKTTVVLITDWELKGTPADDCDAIEPPAPKLLPKHGLRLSLRSP